MNQQMFVEFTALVAAQASLVIEGTNAIPDGPLWVFWQHSQAVLRRWRGLIEIASQQSDRTVSPQVLDIAEQVLITEMLTRVWGTVLTACDLQRDQRHCAQIARSVLNTHQQCRVSVLRLLVHANSVPSERMAELDRLRRRVERWTDLLIGPYVERFGEPLDAFAFDLRRARDFGEEQSASRFQTTSQPTWTFLLAGLRSAFPQKKPFTPSSNNDLLLPILRSILASFPDDAFGGSIKSLRWSRANRSGQHAEGPTILPKSHRNIRRDVAGFSRHVPMRSLRPPTH
ncbi:MAG: hypothetical protein NT013_07160 [Planctomycetia bacterium]|nr:hypothetical protein [Planctomycetia bacterium]